MGKFYGAIGYATLVETAKGVWSEQIVERTYTGDVLKSGFVIQPSQSVNDNVNIKNDISIVVDPFATNNCHMMRYVSYLGVKWKIKDITPTYPRLILKLGDIYNA